MSWVVPLALGGFAVSLMALFSMIGGWRQRRPAAPVAAPKILVHDINDDRCTGCDACVAVCPTNVLGLVNNKSRVLHFSDCIQCEACMWACPTEALVMFKEGSTPPTLKVPELDGYYQTMVPGQYLIGEVAGKPLVKNAANLGRAVVEHMLHGGLRPTPPAVRGQELQVDVVIVGSGPGGLSAALTCVQRGVSYVVLEKEQTIASTIARYPKGKLVMAEPYDAENLSLLPVFDSSKEQLIPVWEDLINQVGVKVNRGEAVESVVRRGEAFEVSTTVARYRAQRVVLATGTRGKPRTLKVPGENLPKVCNLLDDPDNFRGQSVLVVGGGDSAVEAALALADAGARVIVSYRGRSFNRAQSKNKATIERYADEGRIKVKLQSQVIAFEADSVILQMHDGVQKRYPNQAAFVLIGADPPVAWLEKLGVRFVERPHQYMLGKSDEFVRAMVPAAQPCPQDARAAAAQVLGRRLSHQTAAVAALASLPSDTGMEPAIAAAEPSAPRRWLRAATNLFGASGNGTNGRRSAQRAKKLDQPLPLSEFARRQRDGTNGPRDSLSAGERTRVLRMLRDEGGRLADEESHVDFPIDPPVAAPGPAPMVDRARPMATAGLAASMANPAPRPIGRVVPGSNPPAARVVRGSDPPPFRGPRSEPPSMRVLPLGIQSPAGRSIDGTQRGTAPPPDLVRRQRRGAPPPPFGEGAERTKRIEPDSPLAQELRQALGRPPTGSGTPPAQRRVQPIDEQTRQIQPDVLLRAASRRPEPPGHPGEPLAPFPVGNDLLDGGAANNNDARNVAVRRGRPASRVGNDRGVSYSDVEWDLDDV